MKRMLWLGMAFVVAMGTMAAGAPESAYIEGLANDDWPGGVCYLASLGQLMQVRDPAVTATDVMVRSGICSQVTWGSGPAGDTLGFHKRMYSPATKEFQGPMVDAAALCGVEYKVGYLTGGGGGYSWERGAQEVVRFGSEEEAVEALQERIAAGDPVQVHLDFQYVREEAALENPFWAGMPAEPTSHFVVIHGYDADSVWYTDNGPTLAPEADGVGIPLSWENFLDAWYAAGELTSDGYLRTGPYYMCWLTEGPALAPDGFVLAWLAADAAGSGDAVRAGAAAVAFGAAFEVVLDPFTVGRLGESRSYLGTYLSGLGYTEAALRYWDAGAAWELLRMDEDPAFRSMWFDAAAFSEERGAELLAEISAGEAQVVALSPEGAVELGEPAEVTFRWLSMPSVSAKLGVELAVGGDFSDRRGVVRLRTDRDGVSAVLGVKDWLKVIKVDEGDRSLLWRVAGSSRDGEVSSEVGVLSWQEPAMTAVGPDDGAVAGAGEDLVFTFDAPTLCLRPMVVISGAGDFGDRRQCYRVPAKRGEMQAVLAAKRMAALLKKDDGDGVFYWRVEDVGAKRTGVAASEVRSFATAP